MVTGFFLGFWSCASLLIEVLVVIEIVCLVGRGYISVNDRDGNYGFDLSVYLFMYFVRLFTYIFTWFYLFFFGLFGLVLSLFFWLFVCCSVVLFLFLFFYLLLGSGDLPGYFCICVYCVCIYLVSSLRYCGMDRMGR